MKTLTDLREILGETMRAVIDGKCSVEQAKAVAEVATQVNATARLEIDMVRAIGDDCDTSGFVEVKRNPKMRHH